MLQTLQKYLALRSTKPSCFRGWVMQQNICYIDHHWDWEHLLQVKTTFLVALQGEIRNSGLQQAGKAKSAWLDSPTLQDFCYFWWDKKQTNITQEPPAQVQAAQWKEFRSETSSIPSPWKNAPSTPVSPWSSTVRPTIRNLGLSGLSQACLSQVGMGSLLLHEDAWRETLAAASPILQLALLVGLETM